LGRAQASDLLQRSEYRINDCPAAVTLKLDYVLASRACRPIEPQHERIIEDAAILSPEHAQGSLPSCRQRSGELPPRRMGQRAANADDAHRRWGAAARKGEDRVDAHTPRLAQLGAQANSLPSPTSGCTHPS